ncbi:MAG: hypothetical protein ACR2IJ_00030 [Fluviibacter sp.]
MTRDIAEMILQADIETAHANKPMTERENRMYWIERYTAIVRTDCAQACYTRAAHWKDNAAKAARLCGDAIISKVKA